MGFDFSHCMHWFVLSANNNNFKTIFYCTAKDSPKVPSPAPSDCGKSKFDTKRELQVKIKFKRFTDHMQNAGKIMGVNLSTGEYLSHDAMGPNTMLHWDRVFFLFHTFNHHENVLQEFKRIVGGTITREGRFPWLVGLGQGNPGDKHSDKWHPVCGGAIIDKDRILTAAHCFIVEDENQKPVPESQM